TRHHRRKVPRRLPCRPEGARWVDAGPSRCYFSKVAAGKRDDQGNLSCSFCGKSQKEVKKLIAGPTVYICDECIGLCNDIIAEEVEKDEPYAGSTPIPKPSEIKAVLDEYVVGQERAKKILAVAVHNHYKRIDSRVSADDVELSKSNILLLCGGAFVGLDQIIQRRVGQAALGFGADIKSKKEFKLGELLELVQPEDLLKFGLIPEFIGRLPVLATLHELNEEALVDILTKPKNSLVKQFQKLFEMDGVKLKFTKGSLVGVAREALSRNSR